jgi:predicted dithiol-disulfide oxidoreductase (DUF899 family)
LVCIPDEQNCARKLLITIAEKLQGEKEEHRKLGDQLLYKEIAYKVQRESIAALQRQLPM